MSYVWDRYERNEVTDAEREEGRAAQAAMSEMDRVTCCGHTNRSKRTLVCPDCGDSESAY